MPRTFCVACPRIFRMDRSDKRCLKNWERCVTHPHSEALTVARSCPNGGQNPGQNSAQNFGQNLGQNLGQERGQNPGLKPAHETDKDMNARHSDRPAWGGLADIPEPPRFFPGATLEARIPWPVETLSAPLNPDPECLHRMLGAPRPLLRMAYRLFYLSLPQGEALLSLALTAAREVLVADFKCAERNLELPCITAAACLRGLCGVRGAAFIRAGGLEGMVHRLELTVSERHPLLGGAAVLLRLRAAR